MPDRAVEQPGPGGVAQPQHLALDGAHGHGGLGREALQPRGSARRRRAAPAPPPPCVPSRRTTPRTRSSSASSPRTGVRGRTRAARALDRLGQRGDEAAGVDGVVAREVEGEADGRGERGLGAAGARGEEALRAEAEGAADGELPVELLGVVAVARHDERAARPVARDRGPRPRPARRRRRRSPRAARSPSRSSGSSPRSASATGASMPAATVQAPGSPASRTATRRPRRAARHALARPIGPPPTTATSSCGFCGQPETAPSSFPTPARPGSGSTVGGPVPPSQPVARAPVCAPHASAARLLDCIQA